MNKQKKKKNGETFLFKMNLDLPKYELEDLFEDLIK